MPKAKLAKPTKKAATTRKLSPYNEFMKKELPKYKAANPDVEHKMAFKAVAGLWKTAPENSNRKK
ncbi:hypothetical protein IWQ60_006229 [Tieghemiomyces parasiticus]|uniref:YABBY protein C-terminal domain-containing protein n=1 Tax=Tieghemiomyces parasiticus TaxID=78921 RepID=A0A9W8DSD2_9FUNG|nr:hypothetical protein IWQ60_006229 [Tieghemiomyces parasiticus]